MAELASKFDGSLERRGDTFGVSDATLATIADAQDTADAAAAAVVTEAAARAAADTAEASTRAAADTTLNTAITTHVADTANPHAVTAAQAGAVPTTRTVSPATNGGLTGGGDLSANRTFAVDFGSGTNQVRRGDDSAYTNSRAPTGSAGGSLGGTYPNPTVAKLDETSGPTALVIGAIADGSLIQRVGSTVIGADSAKVLSVVNNARKTYRSELGLNSAVGPITSQQCAALYLGYIPAGKVIRSIRFRQASTLAVGAGQAEVGLASSPSAPNGASQTLTVLAAGVTASLTATANAVKKNAVDLAYTLTADTHLWALMRAQYATTMPTMYMTAGGADNEAFGCNFKNSIADLTTLIGTTISTWSVGGTGVSLPYLTAHDFF